MLVQKGRVALNKVAIRLTAVLIASFLAASCGGIGIRQFLAFEAPVVALTHVRVIDGSGQPVKDDQTVIIEGDRITAVGAADSVTVPGGAKVLDLRGRTVLPGLVGMHDHLFYQMGSQVAVRAAESFAMLYLASGVTTIRTAGAFDLASELRIKRLIDAGDQPGPTIYVSSPYLNTVPDASDPARSAGQVAAWADQGATSFKAYTSLRRDELEAVVKAAHERRLKVTGHLCAVGFQEAVGLGIDNLEHGLLVDTEFFSGNSPISAPTSPWPSASCSRLTSRGQRFGSSSRSSCVEASRSRRRWRFSRPSRPARRSIHAPWACSYRVSRRSIAPNRPNSPMRTRKERPRGAGC
jgi:hypothetical protein